MIVNALLTFDYELFFGDNFLNEKDVLFKPTDNLLETLKKGNTKAVFFIDIMSIVAYRKYNQLDYIEQFTNQIQKIKQLGHDIQMHFHPHWIDSVYINNKWSHRYENWSFSDLIKNKGLGIAKNILTDAHNLFLETVGKQPIAFRAGGYTIQPHEKELFTILYELGYKIDSSIVPNKKFNSSVQYFDFLTCEDKNYWNISKGSKFIKETKEQSVIIKEIPIMSLNKYEVNSKYMLKLIYIYLRIKRKLTKRIVFQRRGMGAVNKSVEFVNNSLSITFDNSSMQDLGIMNFFTSTYIKKYVQNKEVIINIVSHPKSIFNESLVMMENYILFLRNKYEVKFLGFEDLRLIDEN